MKSLKIGDVVWVDWHKAKVCSLPNKDGDMLIVLDEGLLTETFYGCSIHDISLDNGGDWALDKKFVPVVGDVIKVDEKEYQLLDIEENVVTLKRNDEIRYYSFYDIEHDIIDDYWISSMCEQVRSPTVQRKLEVYEAQDDVYSYNSLDELKEIYELLGKPHIPETYAKSKIDTLIDSLQHKHGLIYYWEDYDSEWDYKYKYMKAIDGAYIKDEVQ